MSDTKQKNADRWNRIEELFQSAIELPSSLRSQYLAQACGNDAELLLEIESLLANDNATTALDSIVEGDLRVFVQSSDAREIGVHVGPYRLVREIDRGGMGVVYLAVRSDDQYFQIVAVKMIRQGFASPGLVQRFRAERQTLATLNHPNIGTILDGGDTEDGRPFIAMEYVEGQPITSACENRGLSIRQRVELFRSVCSAVHYAHQKLIIHRDIKPSNVLVTPEGVVKLIDFGVSKPLRPELIPGELPKTESGLRLMTPDYASPEQLLGQELTTATDIYSLGVLLFELLTGSRPYTLGDISPAAAERLVCGQETPKPSSVKGLLDQAKKELQGDLDRIVLMAMEKDPARRYLSAQHLEEDLFRFLEAKPVLARKATPVYRLGKFFQRHKTASWMALATSIVLAGSILFYSWRSRLADRRVKEMEKLADSAISDISEKLQQSSVPVETQAALFQSALQYLEQLRKSSGNDPQVLLELAKAYERVGDLQGSPVAASLGNSEAALHSYQEALQVATEAHSRLPGEASTKALIEAYQKLAYMEYSWVSLENLQRAIDHYQQCLPLARDFWQQNPEDPTRKSLLAYNYSGLAFIEEVSREPDKALQNFRTAIQILGSEPNGDETHDRRLSTLYGMIGRQFSLLGGNRAEVFVNLREAVTIAEGLTRISSRPKDIKRYLYFAYADMVEPLGGEEMLNVGEYNQAQAYAHKALTIAEEMAVSDSKNADARTTLGYAYFDMGGALRVTQPATAAAWYRKSILLAKEMSPPSEAEFHVATREEALAGVLVKEEQAAERLDLLLDSNARRQKLASSALGLPLPRQKLMRSDCTLSDAELALHDLTKARQYADLSLPFLTTFPLSSPDLRILRDVGLCYETLGNVQRQIALSHSVSSAQRLTALTDARQWYLKSAGVWNEWNERGAATPESEAERRKVQRLLQLSDTKENLEDHRGNSS